MSTRAVSKALNIADVQRLANQVLPRPIRDYLEGGADREWTLQRNLSAFNDWVISHRSLVDVSKIDPSTNVIGLPSAIPVILSPTGMSQLFHASGEAAVARAAARAGVPYGLSTMATTSIEVVAEIGGARYFQLYLFRDRGLTRALLERAAASGYRALCLTVDTAVSGNRERDLRSGMIMPPRFNLRSMASIAMHPRWSLSALRNRKFELANVHEHVGNIAPNGTNVIDYVNAQFDRSATWEDLEWLRSEWPGQLVLKGVVHPDDCKNAVQCGVDAIMISNHGGRQLDGIGSALDYLPGVRDRIQDSAQLVVDGGVRRGTDVLKALALGADGCSIGRPYLYGLAAAGQAGVAKVLEIFRTEIERGMALMGCQTISQLGPAHIDRLGTLHSRLPGYDDDPLQVVPERREKNEEMV